MFVLGSTNLPDPNDFKESREVTGGYVKTMGGGTRRNIKAIKFIYSLSWYRLTQSEFTSLKNEYDKETTLSFVNSELGINTTVYMDMDERSFVAGTDYLSNVSIVLREA